MYFPIGLFEQTGQYEPLTTRIRNILQEYKEGEGIFKELIQNADDAGASTVKFLVDWRKGRTGSLVSPGMAECQGPALWAYNNAVFTDEDFVNINKLAGETKVDDISKIGRFGLGFNTVYHLTDVPSFISREYLVVFDPNIHHLEPHIKDRSRPGIRINLAEKPECLTRYQDQFQPYNGVFGCSTRGRFYYDATLFRFPFRTALQAGSSDISKTVYGRSKVEDIVSSLCECASTLLIFPQNVKEVEVYELDESSEPGAMRLVLSVRKPCVETFGLQGISNEEPFIKQCSKWWVKYRQSQIGNEHPSCCELVSIVTTKEPSELSRCKRKHSCDLIWFVVSASGTDASLAIANSSEGRARGFLPCGGVAFVSQRSSEQGSWKLCVTSDPSGELFCFLPLSIPTGLPVHLNGYFAIMSNRVEIWKRTNMPSQPIEVEWNEALMEDALARAYIMLLEKMKDVTENVKDYEFHTLWPSCDVVDMQSWEKLVRKVCSVLLDHRSKLFYSDGKWMSVNNGFLLSDDFNEIYETAVEVSRALGIHVFNLPWNILQTLKKYDRENILQRRTLCFLVFMKHYFFPKISTLTSTQRNDMVCFGLDRILKVSQSLHPSSINEINLFQQNACISVSRDGRILAKPGELINPFSPAAKLFTEKDHRLPVGKELRDSNRLYVLETLGMVKDLDWEGIHERAQSIADGAPHAKRSRELIKYLNKRVDNLSKSPHYRNLLQHVKFLPVLKEPVDGFLLPWKESKLPLSRFCAPNELFLPSDAKLIGSSCYILNTSYESGCGELNSKVKNLLGFFNRLPEVKLVIQQLDEAIRFWSELSEGKRKERKRSAIQSVCEKIYGFFRDMIVERARIQSFLTELDKRDWLFLEGEFVPSHKVAFTSNGDGAPFLFTLPPDYKREYRHLFEAMRIKHTFVDEDYINALYELKSTKKGGALTKNELQIAIFFVTQIDVQNPAVKDHYGKIPLPDTGSILRRSRDITVNLDLWLTDRDNNVKVHQKIPPQTARALGAKSLKSVVLKKWSHRIDYGESFGQQEDLTDRLKGILDGYPEDGILKELVQNADDAQASEIHFIYDTRTLGSESVATEEASEEIQGPALCVYNDKPFTKEDLEGIKKLGIGSKRDSLGVTGKYGIGFNSVYHLTDCPSFLSNNDTLAFLDPHCRYFLYDDRGRLFKLKSMDKEFQNNISNTLDGYLREHFDLKHSTMFRLPLRRKKNESKISSLSPDMEKLLSTFQKQARKSLLFLNHVKKITVSKIHPNNKLEEIYRVEIVISSEDEKKRQEMQRTVCKFSGTPTAEIQWQGVNYTVTVKENNEKVERWLIQKCIGSDIATLDTSDGERYEIPDGHKLGLLPRGGLATRLWTTSSPPGQQKTLRGIVYCFQPLPENYTNLPVHVNGHFALDSTRRRLWTDTNGKGEKSKWNHFINSCVLPPAYAALIMEARNHLCNDDHDNQLLHYHALFPDVLSDSPWKTLTTELYHHLGRTKAKILPLLVPEAITRFLEKRAESSQTMDCFEALQPLPVTLDRWLSVDHAYFVTFSELEEKFLLLLIRIGIPVLLHAPHQMKNGFKSAGVTLYEVSPRSIVKYLREFQSRESSCKIENLPKKLDTTVVESVTELSALIQYCREDEEFAKHLEGLPLLLTQDGYLRVFDSNQPVFCSKVGDLFPEQSHQFLHREVVNRIPRTAIISEENIVLEFTVQHVAEMLQHVFSDEVLKAIKNESTWKFPAEGILSKQWFKKFWNFLQNHTKPEPNEDFVSLKCLWKWPVIPTTCGKLVTIKDAKSVLDMTPTGTESTAQENVRTFLTSLECPVLDKKLTFNNKHFSYVSGAVTDPYVAHPYNVADVLVVLHYMMNANNLHLSKVYEDEICDFLRFVQDNYRRSKAFEQCKLIIKNLPFHKTLSEQFVSLTDHRSYALIPSCVPTQQLDELQERAKCIFLCSDALPTLKTLYKDIGIEAIQNVAQFYTEYVLKHFNWFTRESQLKHLVHIRDIIHASFPKGPTIEKTRFLQCLTQTPCIPDQYGHLHLAGNFFDPNNDVFKLMYKCDGSKFPPSPFNESEWSDLLQAIGLRVNITPQLFQEFCLTVAERGRYSPGDQDCRAQSKALVRCLFSEEFLREDSFPSKISQVMFIAPDKVEEELSLIHQQYQSTENGSLPFIKFSNAVPWCLRYLAWTTDSLLPEWPQLQLNNKLDLKNLGVACSGPAYTNVIEHLQNVVRSASSECPDYVDGKLVHEITRFIYRYLQETSECCYRSPDDECCDVCIDIGIRLSNISCIFLQEDKFFARANQLVFKLNENCPFKPFLFPVPRELREFEHLLKRLGATEKPTPLQIAFVLDSVHEEVGEEALLDSTKLKIVKYAMHALFELLYKGESADGINELYLPSQDKQLLKSSKMVCNISPRFTEVIERYERPILLRFEECKLRKVVDSYIDALPEHLRPSKFDEIVREEVDPRCKVSICPKAQQGSMCSFQEQFQNLLQSDEFMEGLERLLMEDSQNPQESEQTIRKLQTDVVVKCTGFEKIKISVIDRETNVVVDHLTDSCYAVQDEETWYLYMQHDLRDSKTLASAAECVNKILGNCVRKEIGLIAMLGCFSPSEIENELNRRNIIQGTSDAENDGDDDFADLHDEISEWDSGDERDERGVEGSGGMEMNGNEMGGGASFPNDGYGVGYRGRGGDGGHSR